MKNCKIEKLTSTYPYKTVNEAMTICDCDKCKGKTDKYIVLPPELQTDDFSFERSLTDSIIHKVAEHHKKILDAFFLAFVSSRYKDYFSKQKKIDFKRIKLVHQIKTPVYKDGVHISESTYFLRLTKGKLPKLK